MLGGLLAFLSAALFGLNNAATRRGVLGGSVIQGVAISVPLGVVLFLAACLLTGTLGEITRFSGSATTCFAIAGILHFVLGRYCNYRAIAAIGTNLASPIQQWEVLVTLALAMMFLGEKLTPLSVIAIALLLLGPAVASRIEAVREPTSVGAAVPAASEATNLKFEPRYREGYTWAFLSIFGYGLSPIFVRAGLDGAGVGASFAAGLVSYIAATLVVVLWIVGTRQVAHVRELEAEPCRWFALAGILVFLSHLLRYMALALIPVSIVAPIMRMQSLFRIYWSWLLTRDYEVFDRNVMIGTVISVAGAVLLTLPPDAVVQWLPLPDWMRAGLAWRWP